MATGDTIPLRVERRYCGPPGSANGGYICGLISAALDRTVTVRLTLPVPLDTTLELLQVGESEWRLQGRELTLAQVRAARLEIDVPAPPTYIQAMDASLRFGGLANHPCPGCFVCGTQRAAGDVDGMHLFAGSTAGGLVAAPWLPGRNYAGRDGAKVAPEFMSAALDCPGFFSLAGVPSALLGEFTAHIDRCVHVDEPCVVIGWPLGTEGRKHSVGTAVFDEDGELCAYARGLWIEPRG